MLCELKFGCVIVVLYCDLGCNWSVVEFVVEVGVLCLVFVECFFVVIGMMFVCYLIELWMWFVV